MDQAVEISCLLLLLVYSGLALDIHTTKVFLMPINSSFFNWTDPIETYTPNMFFYRPSLLDAPDLPSWMYYTFSEQQNQGFVYGAAPQDQKDLEIEVIGLNKQNYEVRRRIIKLNVVELTEPALYEVHLKVDKLNVRDILDSDRYYLLLDVFRKNLWPDSSEDLYITFLASAVQLGARLPLNPFEGEGVIMHVGSRAPFSHTLLDLQHEVSPLRSKGQTTCPDFKHTSVERFFKQHNFSLDWCAFQLSENKPMEKSVTVKNPGVDPLGQLTQPWHPISKQELPTDHYLTELAVVMIIPLSCMFIMTACFTFILCFQQEMMKRNDNTPHSQLVRYEAVQRATNNLRSLSTHRDCEETSPRLSVERTGFRPHPPPYSGLQNLSKDGILDDDEEDTKTWYC